MEDHCESDDSFFEEDFRLAEEGEDMQSVSLQVALNNADLGVRSFIMEILEGILCGHLQTFLRSKDSRPGRYSYIQLKWTSAQHRFFFQTDEDIHINSDAELQRMSLTLKCALFLPL